MRILREWIHRLRGTLGFGRRDRELEEELRLHLELAQYPAFKTIASEPRFQTLMRLVALPR